MLYRTRRVLGYLNSFIIILYLFIVFGWFVMFEFTSIPATLFF